MTSIHYHPQGRKEAIMSEQSSDKAKAAARAEDPEVEGHSKAALNEDPSRAALSDEVDEDGPEVEGHFKTRRAADPSKQA